MANNPFIEHQEDIKKIAKKNNISYLALFGSHARGDQKKDSDIDLLVEFSKPVGLIHLINTEHQFEDILNKKIDLITKNGLSKHIKPYIENDLITIYETI